MKILTVDDEWLALEGLQRAVEKAAPTAEIMAFGAPSEALEYAKENRVDVAFLDIGLPGMNGLTLAQRLQELYPCVNIIFVTATNQYAMDSWQMHASGYLLKPYRDEEIADEIANLRHAPV